MPASTIALFGLVELFLIYCLTLSAVRDDRDAVVLMRSWWATITLCSLLVIFSYVRAEPLIVDVSREYEGLVAGFGELKESGTVFARASFFTTAFNYPLACTL